MKKGITIIEVIVSVAILGIFFLLIAPSIKSYRGIKERVEIQKEIDKRISIVDELIQKKIRGAKEVSNISGSYVGVYTSFDSSTFDFSGNLIGHEGSVLYLEVTNSTGNTEDVFFIFEDNKLKYREGINGINETLLDKVEKVTFKIQDGIIIYFIDLDVEDYEDKTKNSFRSAASTRIDLN